MGVPHNNNMGNGDLYCVNKDDASIWKWNYGEPDSWEKVGDRCKNLLVTGARVVCVNNEDNSLWEWQGEPDAWTKIGGGCGAIGGHGDNVFCVNRDDGSIWHNTTPHEEAWTKIGGGASRFTTPVTESS